MIKLLPFYKIENEILCNRSINANEKLVLVLIKSFYQTYGPQAECRLSNTQFMQVLGITKHTLLNALDHLEKLRLIEIMYSKPKGVRSNRVIKYLRDNEKQLLPEDMERLKQILASYRDAF